MRVADCYFGHMRGDRRRQRLKKAIVEFAGKARGSDRRFAQQVNIKPAVLSQLKTGHRSITDTMAARIESGLSLHEGWLDDVPHPDVVSPPQTESSIFQRLFDRLPPALRNQVLIYMHALVIAAAATHGDPSDASDEELETLRRLINAA